jgi:SAM-dependent methyltransferase
MNVKPTAFDSFAGGYDETFTYSKLGRLLRPRVWEKLARHFVSGQHILELTCGTGEDAIWLAKRGVQVMATDGSLEMVNVARVKAEAAGVADQVAVAQISLQEMATGYFHEAELKENPNEAFDGVFSNFGGLNTISDWQPLAEAIAELVRPGGKAVLVPMGPVCPWEIVWHLGHAQPKTALRRFGGSAPAKIGDAVIPIWYPSATRLKRDFAPWFKHLYTESLGLLLPPSYLDHLVNRWPAFFAKADRLEQLMAPLTKGWGDHYIIIFERT